MHDLAVMPMGLQPMSITALGDRRARLRGASRGSGVLHRQISPTKGTSPGPRVPRARQRWPVKRQRLRPAKTGVAVKRPRFLSPRGPEERARTHRVRALCVYDGAACVPMHTKVRPPSPSPDHRRPSKPKPVQAGSPFSFNPLRPPDLSTGSQELWRVRGPERRKTAVWAKGRSTAPARNDGATAAFTRGRGGGENFDVGEDGGGRATGSQHSPRRLAQTGVLNRTGAYWRRGQESNSGFRMPASIWWRRIVGRPSA